MTTMTLEDVLRAMKMLDRPTFEDDGGPVLIVDEATARRCWASEAQIAEAKRGVAEIPPQWLCHHRFWMISQPIPVDGKEAPHLLLPRGVRK